MTPHFVVVPIIIVPEFLTTDAVFNGKLQSAPILQKSGHDDLESELVSDTIAWIGHVGGQTVHKCYPVVQGVAQRDALFESQVQDAHDPGEVEFVRFHALQWDFHFPDFLLKAG